MDNLMIDTKAVIDSLRAVYNDETKGLSVDKVYEMVYKSDPVNYPSRTSIARLLRKDGGYKFRWESTIRPVANVLLNLEDSKPDEDSDTHAYKSILKLKKDTIMELEDRIFELETELEKAKHKYHEKLATEAEKFQKSLDFAKNQILLKDKRIDQLLNDNHLLIEQLLQCTKCKRG